MSFKKRFLSGNPQVDDETLFEQVRLCAAKIGTRKKNLLLSCIFYCAHILKNFGIEANKNLFLAVGLP